MAQGKETPGKGKLLLGMLFMGLSGTAALIYLARQPKAPAGGGPRPDDMVAIDMGPAAFETLASSWGGRAGMPSSDLLGRERREPSVGLTAAPVYTQDSTDTAAAFGPAQAPAEERGARPASRPPAAPPRAPSAELDEKEKNKLGSVVGRLDENGTKKLAESGTLLTRAVEKLLDHPKLVGFLLNNKTLAKGFMKTGLTPKLCKDPKALASWMADTKSSEGVGMYMKTFQKALQKPETAGAIVGSELAKTVFDECGAVNTLTHDPSLVKEVAIGNPGFFMMLGDPALAGALAANPQAMAAVGDMQSSSTKSP